MVMVPGEIKIIYKIIVDNGEMVEFMDMDSMLRGGYRFIKGIFRILLRMAKGLRNFRMGISIKGGLRGVLRMGLGVILGVMG